MEISTKKIKVPVSAFVLNQLQVDVEDYDLKGIGEICNRILVHYRKFRTPVISEGRENFKGLTPLQFNLHKDNRRFLNFVENLKLKLASVCRHYFEEYTALPRAQRELLINSENVDVIKKAIVAGEQTSFEYRNETLTVSPCFIANSPSNVHAYLTGFVSANHNSEGQSTFRAFRISRIKNAAQITGSKAAQTADFKISQQVEAFKEHFDPFLCYGQTVTANLTVKGLKIYNRAKTNRPKMISKTNSSDGVRYTCIFQCSEKLAEIYFPQFLDEIEIIAPDELRTKFKERLMAALRQYKTL